MIEKDTINCYKFKHQLCILFKTKRRLDSIMPQHRPKWILTSILLKHLYCATHIHKAYDGEIYYKSYKTFVTKEFWYYCNWNTVNIELYCPNLQGEENTNVKITIGTKVEVVEIWILVSDHDHIDTLYQRFIFLLHLPR